MISIRGLVKAFGNTTAVSDLDLEVQRGEFLALLGPSGCGKTTTLRCIAGLESIDKGEIVVDGRTVATSSKSLAPEDRGIGMVFQSYALWPHMTVYQNVAFGLKLKGLSKAIVIERVAAILDLVGLSGLSDRGVSQISGGQQQRVSLARALVLEPKVLLFDEPLSNLDAVLRERMRFEIRHIQQRLGITSVYVTHDQQEAFVIADRILVMQSGKVIQNADPVEIYNQPKTRFVAEFVGLVNLFPGTVTIDSGGVGSVTLEAGLQLECKVTGHEVGQSVNLIIRPEEVVIFQGPEQGTNIFEALVVRSAFLGSYTDVYLQGQGMEIRAQSSPPRLWLPNQSVKVKLPPEKIILTK